MPAQTPDFESQLRLVFHRSPNLVFFKDESLRYTSINDSLAAVLGCRPDEAIGTSDRSIYSAEIAEHLEEVDRAALKAGYVERTVMRPSKGVLQAFSAVRIQTPTGVFGIDRQMGAQTPVASPVRAALGIQPLLESSPLAVIEWNANHEVVSWMGGAVRLFGWTANEVVGKAIDEWKFVFEDDKRNVAQVQRVMDEGRSSVSLNRNYCKDGRVVHCEWYNSVVTDGEGRLTGALSLVLDTTSRVKAEQALMDSEDRFRDLFEAAPTGIFRSTLEGRFIWLNPRFASIFEYSSVEEMMEAVQDIPHQLFYDPAERGHVLELVLQTDDFVNIEVTYRRAGGQPLLTTLHVRAVRDADHQPLYLEGFVEDITERRKAEVAIKEANAALELRVKERTAELSAANEQLKELDRLKSQFLASMSHELRTPLNSIIGFTSLLKRGLSGPVSDEQIKQLSIVHSCSKHLLDLINDLLDVSSIEAGRAPLQIGVFEMREVVSDVVASLKPLMDRKNLELSFQMVPEKISVEGDRKRIYQILLNLANNALKFTDRGSVHIDVQVCEMLTVTVSDTGIGIRPEQIVKLFEAFQQLDGSARRGYEGTGLGLYISRKLLDLMGGRIDVASEYGKGSRFTFYVPLKQSASRGMTA